MKVMLKIFPYALVRYAAMPFHALDTLCMPGIAEHITATGQLEAALLQQREALCNQLFTAVKAAQDHQQRQRLLQLKRNVFNGKMPSLEGIAPERDADLYAALQAYVQLYSTQQARALAWEQAFAQQVVHSRRQLQVWSQEEMLRSGILLSSPVLYGQLPAFAAADPAAFRNRELKNEYSLLRYVTRMAAKTSPFSTFTYTGTALLDAGRQGLQQPFAPPGVSSSIRLHNGLFAYLRTLMIHHPVLNELLEVQLNVTATVQEAQLCFLVNYFNVEAFQRLPARNLPLWLFRFLQEQQAPLTLGGLTDLLAQQLPDTDRSSIKVFLLKLVNSGFLEPGVGCSGVDPGWDAALARFLEPHRHRHTAAGALYDMLQTLAGQKVAYAVADATGRQRLLEAAAGSLNALLRNLQAAAGLPVTDAAIAAPPPLPETAAHTPFEVNRFAPRHFLPQDIFYEDACTPVNGCLPAAALQDLITHADRLCSLLEPLDTLQEERQRMRDFFLQHYGPAHAENVTAFYHAYYLHEKKQAQAGTQAQQELLQAALPIPAGMGVRVQPARIDICVQEPAAGTGGIGRGMFVQLYTSLQNGASVLQGVVNALLPGMGKVAGRFLHLFDPAITAAFREWNTALHPDCLMMELNDGSTFNANIHPPLLDHEIGMPGGNPNYPPGEGRVALRDVMVRYNEGTNLLSLCHARDNREIYAYDLCLESFYNRSHFYRLLAHFNPEQRLPLRRLITALDQQYMAAYIPGEEVQLRPRIVFEGQVVIRRQGWLLQTAAIPAQQQGETDAAYFLRLQAWRLRHGLPEHAFLFLRSPYIKTRPGQQNRLQRDDYKPQYLCFTQPLLVALLKKLLSRAGEYCYLEEMLPHASHLPAGGGTVTEYMLHWYKY